MLNVELCAIIFHDTNVVQLRRFHVKWKERIIQKKTCIVRGHFFKFSINLTAVNTMARFFRHHGPAVIHHSSAKA
jgi:hypothetical protein